MTVSTAPRCYALVPCAGHGSRAGSAVPKQYVPIAGRPMVAHTLAALADVARVEATLVVLAPDDTAFEPLVGGETPRRWLARCGAGTRAGSVVNGLGTLLERGARDDDWVLVHDAARCLVRPAWIDRLIDECLNDAVGGLLAQPLADTLKQAGSADPGHPTPGGAPSGAALAGWTPAAARTNSIDSHGGMPAPAESAPPPAGARVAATIDRQGKWAAQTPQMFRLGLLQRALRVAGPAVTDEASAVEALGLAPRLVPGRLENLKVTWPEDFDLAARLLGSASSGLS